MSISEDIQKYIENDRRDTGHERLLLKELKLLPQKERYEILQSFVDDSYIAVMLAQKASLSSSAYHEIWEGGLIYSNASSIQWWVVTVAANLGWRKTFKLFQVQIDLGNEKIAEAMYHVPFIFDKLAPSPKMKEQFIQLVTTAKEAGLLHFNPDSVWGSGWRA